MSKKSSCLRAAAAAGIVFLSPNMATYAQESTGERVDEPIDEVVVRAHPLAAENLAQPVSTLRGDELDRALAPSIAETLRNVPGVHSSSFGQAVGRPVIRGLGGARVKTLEDRIDSMDVSVSSPDHLTTIEPFAAQSIEVLKGPSTLLYGTGAIGGIVNVNTGRIPQQLPDGLSGAAQLRTADNADRQTGAIRLDASAGTIAFHLDAFYRDADDFEIPGFAESAALRELEALEGEEHGGHEGEEHGEEEEAFGMLPNSRMEMQGGAIGLSRVGERGFIGLSVSTLGAEYGLPGHSHEHGHEHEGEEEHGAEEEGGAFLDSDQTRIDVEAGLDAPFAGVRNVNLRFGFNDYEHIEFEGNGEPGTVFANEALEGRLELLHERAFGFEGATGLQLSSREFSALGEEAFVQPVDTQTVGVFYVGQRSFGDTGLEVGVRYENVDHDPTSAASRSFDLGAASVGLIQPFADHWTLSGQFDYSNRAPVAEELYSDGPHLVTGTYEIGDPNLTEERATNISVSLAYEQESLHLSLNVYQTEFADFIYEVATGAELNELPVLEWRQADATFRGLEAHAGWEAFDWGDGALTLNASYDVVRARLDSGENRNLPRIPPQRWRIGAVVNAQNLLAEVSFGRVDSQSDTAAGELPTEAYDDLRVHLSYGLDLGDNRLELFLTGRNLTDDEQRYHTSYIKDFAPQPGRTIEAGVSWRL